MFRPNYIPYYKPQETDYGVFSIDKLIITGKVIHNRKQALANYISHKSEFMPDWKLYDKNTCPLKFRTFADLVYDTEKDSPIGMTVQIGRNDFDNRVNDEIKIELNPNKLFDSKVNINAEEAKKDYRHILDECIPRSLKVIEFDIALDIPTERQNVTILPQNGRTYNRVNGDKVIASDDKCVIVDADDYTQYVGKRHSNGYTKVYNKQIERKLSSPMTRVEITIKTEEFKKDFSWTKVYYRPPGDDKQLELKDYKPATEEERFIDRLLTLLQVPSEEIPKFKSRRMREKYKSRILGGYTELRLIDIPQIYSSIKHINDFVNEDIFAEVPQDLSYNEDRFLSRNIYLRSISKYKFVPYEIVRDSNDDTFNKAVQDFAYMEHITIDAEKVKPYSYISHAYCTTHEGSPASLNLENWTDVQDELCPF